MSLLRVLQSDLASVLMQYLDTSHAQLLEIARPPRSSQTFAMAVTTQHSFNLFKFAEHLRGDVLCRRAVEHTRGSESHFDRLWASIPENIITTDFLAFACVLHDSMAYKYVPLAVRDDSTFVHALVNHAKTFEAESDICPLVPAKWIPDAMLADREFAMACAEKGVWPFGSENQLYLYDQEIVEQYLKTRQNCDPDVYAEIRVAPWCGRDWVLHMCRDAPETAKFLLSQTYGTLQVEIIETIPIDYVYETFSNDGVNVHHRLQTWRIAVRREPRVLNMLGVWCVLLPSDESLLIRAFRENPIVYSSCSSYIKSLDYVARVTFSHGGLQIRNSPYLDNKQFALIAVRQNGLALKYLSLRLRLDNDVVLQAVQQNGLALAWAWHSYAPNLIRAAIQQNPAAVAFMNI